MNAGPMSQTNICLQAHQLRIGHNLGPRHTILSGYLLLDQALPQLIEIRGSIESDFAELGPADVCVRLYSILACKHFGSIRGAVWLVPLARPA